MSFVPFELERWQAVWENKVRFNLAESGVHPLSVDELLEITDTDPAMMGSQRLVYSQSNGTDELRATIASLYPGTTDENVLVTVALTLAPIPASVLIRVGDVGFARLNASKFDPFAT